MNRVHRSPRLGSAHKSKAAPIVGWVQPKIGGVEELVNSSVLERGHICLDVWMCQGRARVPDNVWMSGLVHWSGKSPTQCLDVNHDFD